MTIPRTAQIDLSTTPYYHIMTRCVRRTFLCGVDSQSGQDFSHRKTWLVNKFKELASIFAIKIAAYAVMSNHYHLVLFVDEEAAKSWTHDEIKHRWGQIFPHDAQKVIQQEKAGSIAPALLQAKYEEWRERLTSISWFMRCINEPIARMSNYEDKCTGRFWEGRFKSQALLDEGALLSAMVYVDLNPIRAGLAETPEASEYTSIYERIQFVAKQLKSQQSPKSKAVKNTPLKRFDWDQKSDECIQAPQLMPFYPAKSGVKPSAPSIAFSFSDYLELVDATGRSIRDDKRGAISEKLSPILERLNLTEEGWFMMTNELEKGFSHFVGPDQLQALFKRLERKKTNRPLKKAA